MSPQLAAIVWAQWRTLRNFKGRAGARILAGVAAFVWYGAWSVLAVFVAFLAKYPANAPLLPAALSWGFMVAFLYWQVAPIITVSLGASLDLKKLLTYPIPREQFFIAEVLLRLTAGSEVVLVLAGVLVGVSLNPAAPWWGPAIAIPSFIVFNLFVAAGTRSLLDRLFAHKRVREVVVFFFVLAAALPQVLSYTRLPSNVASFFSRPTESVWPWTAAAVVALGGRFAPAGCGVLLLWTVAAYGFGKWQFERGLRFDGQAARSRSSRGAPWLEALYRWPAAIIPDPLAAVMEKELRSLARSPRFRLVFLMGCSFGLLIWLPMSFRNEWWRGHTFSTSFLTLFTAYALFLMSETVFWNVFAFDRGAAQIYFLLPVRISSILFGKNLAALVFVILEVTLITVVCLALRLPVTVAGAVEALAVSFVLCIYLLGVGNLVSIYFPRPSNPEDSWGASNRKQRAFLLLPIFAVVLTPVFLAFLARYAFGSQKAFYAVLGLAALAGVAVYWTAMESAVAAAEKRKEFFLQSLAVTDGPVVTN